MGALPKRKISTGRKGRRRSSQRVKLPKLITCPECGQPTPPHQACVHCHYYKGRSTVNRPTFQKRKKVTQDKKK